jgi:hypothetical protein
VRTLIAGIAEATLTAGLIAAPAVAQNADYSQRTSPFLNPAH